MDALTHTAYVIEPYRLEREALCLLTQACLTDFTCFEFADVEEALTQGRLDGLEVVVVGGLDRQAGGLESLRRLSEGVTPAKTIAVMDRADFTWIRRAAASGVLGFIPRTAGRSAYCQALRLVLSGEVYFPSQEYDRPTASPEAAYFDIASNLSPRQRQVLQLLTQGLTTKDVAAQLGLHLSTVRNHVQAILKTLNVHNRSQAILAVIGASSTPRERE